MPTEGLRTRLDLVRESVAPLHRPVQTHPHTDVRNTRCRGGKWPGTPISGNRRWTCLREQEPSRHLVAGSEDSHVTGRDGVRQEGQAQQAWIAPSRRCLREGKLRESRDVRARGGTGEVTPPLRGNVERLEGADPLRRMRGPIHQARRTRVCAVFLRRGSSALKPRPSYSTIAGSSWSASSRALSAPLPLRYHSPLSSKALPMPLCR